MRRLGSWWSSLPRYGEQEPVTHHGFRGDDAEVFSDVFDWEYRDRAAFPESNRPRVGILRSVLAVVASTGGALLGIASLAATLPSPAVDDPEWWAVLGLGLCLVVVAVWLVVSVVRRTRAHLRALAPVRAEVDRRYRHKNTWLGRQEHLDRERLGILLNLARGDVVWINGAIRYTGLAPSLAVGAWCIPLFFGPWMLWELRSEGLTTLLVAVVVAFTLPLGLCACALAWRRLELAMGLGRHAIGWSRRLTAYAREHHPGEAPRGDTWQTGLRKQPAVVLFSLPPLVLVVGAVINLTR